MHRTVPPAAAALTLLALTLSGSAGAGEVAVASVTASSSFPAEEGANYEPDKVTDGKAGTAWVEGDQGSGLGSWIELSLPGETQVKELHVWAGMWYSAEFWERGNRPKELEITLSDGSKKTCNLTDEKSVQVCAIGAKTSSLKLKVKGTYDGTTWLDTAISEVRVIDDTADSRLKVVATEKSSALPSDADGSYEVENTFDGLVDTMWCEGNKDGDGTGEFIEFHFDGTKKVGQVELVNGIGGSVKYWMLGNRATKATLSFSDGSSQQIEIKNSARAQTISFAPRSTKMVKITFDEVYKGKEYNDLCISEAYFME